MALNGHLLTFLVFFPAAGALALLWLRGDDEVWIRRFALVVSLVEFLASLLMLRAIPIGAVGYPMEEFAKWIVSPPINYHLGADGISMFLVILTTFLTPICVLASWQGVHARIKEFHVMLLLLEVGVVGVFLSLDMFLFFLFWEIMLIPMAFLIGIWGHDRRIYAAVKFVLYTMAGSILMLVGIIWLYNATGTFDLPTIQVMVHSGQLVLSERTEMLLFLAFFVAFAIKVPLFPLHTWLPDAHVEAPTAGSIILAGVLLKMGTYGMIRFCLPLFPEAARRAAPYVAALAIIGIIYGALVALVQPNLKKLVAYSSVSHLGFVVLGIFAFQDISMQGAVYQMLAHGISTGGLFLLVGMLYDRRHTFEITEYGGLCAPMPKLAAFFLFVALSSMGLPMLNGFVGEFLVLLGTYQAHWHWAAWAAYQRVFYGEITQQKNRELKDTSARESLMLWALSVVILWMGINSPFFTRRFAVPCKAVIEQMNPNLMHEAAVPGVGVPGSGLQAQSSMERLAQR
jgi:NADH-quinone oxidoreductase subunit M